MGWCVELHPTVQSCIPTVVLPSLHLDYLAIIHIVTILLAPEALSSLGAWTLAPEVLSSLDAWIGAVVLLWCPWPYLMWHICIYGLMTRWTVVGMMNCYVTLDYSCMWVERVCVCYVSWLWLWYSMVTPRIFTGIPIYEKYFCHSNLIKIHRWISQNNVISMKKSLILTSSSEKFSTHGGPPSGRLLKWRAVSDGPLRGSLSESKLHVILENTLSFSTVFVPV